ncbi:hypothetical protein EVA_16154, partial [gut metagenome]
EVSYTVDPWEDDMKPFWLP